MKVLIITYYWPPSGGSGVQRWLKFVKYLPAFGITPYVFTPENPSFNLKDSSLQKDIPAEAEIIHFPIWEPFGSANKVQGGESKPRGVFQKMKTWLRGNLIFPDPRIFWVRPSVQFLPDFLRGNEIDLVVTTGPPHSVHLIGYRLKKKNPKLRWLADFRDPWSEWGVLQSFNLSSWAKGIHKRMERNVLIHADRVVTISPFYVNQLERLSGRRVDLITNGYDETDFELFQAQATKKFVIRHVGLVNPSCDPRPFMRAVGELVNENALESNIEIIFTGQINEDFREYVKSDNTLSEVTHFQPGVRHSELVKLYGESSVLLLILSGYKDGEGFLPGKLFEYLATGLPILAIGPVPSDADGILRELGLGQMVATEDGGGIKKEILKLYNDWRNNASHFIKADTSRYSRKQLTFKLSEILKSLQ